MKQITFHGVDAAGKLDSSQQEVPDEKVDFEPTRPAPVDEMALLDVPDGALGKTSALTARIAELEAELRQLRTSLGGASP